MNINFTFRFDNKPEYLIPNYHFTLTHISHSKIGWQFKTINQGTDTGNNFGNVTKISFR